MALPKRKHSTARKGKRLAQIKLKQPTLVSCPNCGQEKRPHRACLNCQKDEKSIRPPS